MTTVQQIRDSLRDVVDPCSAATGSDLDIVEMGLVKSVDITDGRVEVQMRLTTPACHMIPFFITEVRRSAGTVSGVADVEVVTDDGTEWTEDMMTAEAKRSRQDVLEGYKARYDRES